MITHQINVKIVIINFFSHVNNLQESEIVEVLWKQDVDLGYTLAPVKSGSSEETTNTSGPSFSTEDNEKLRALQELKNEKVFLKHFYITQPLKLRVCNKNKIEKRLKFL